MYKLPRIMLTSAKCATNLQQKHDRSQSRVGAILIRVTRFVYLIRFITFCGEVQLLHHPASGNTELHIRLYLPTTTVPGH